MPRVPSIQTKEQVSTSLARRSATPANIQTSRALGQLSQTASNLAFQIEGKRQDQKDSAASYSTKNELSKFSQAFQAKEKEIGVDGRIKNGNTYVEDLEENLKSIREAQLEKYRGSVREDTFKNMELQTQDYVDRELIRARNIQSKQSAKKAKFEGERLTNEAADAALTGDQNSAYSSILEVGKYTNAISDTFATPEEAKLYTKEKVSRISNNLAVGQISSGNYLGAIKTAGLDKDKEILASLSDTEKATLKNMPTRDLSNNLTNAQKLRLRNKTESAILEQRAADRSEIKTGIRNLKKYLNSPGIISSEEIAQQSKVIFAKAQNLPEEDKLEVINQVTTMQALGNVSEMIGSMPPSKWSQEEENQLNLIDDSTIEGATLKRNAAASINKMKAEHINKMNKDFAGYAINTDERIQKLAEGALDFNSPQGFAKYKNAVEAKAVQYNINPSTMTILPPAMKQHYSDAIDSGNTAMISTALDQLEQHVGEENLNKALQEINPNGNVAAATNIANKKYRGDLLSLGSKEKQDELNAAWKNRLGVETDLKNDLKEFNKDLSDNKFFQALRSFSDNGKTYNVHQKALESLYKQNRLKGMSHEDATDELTQLFDDKYEMAKSEGPVNKSVIIPKSSGVSSETAQVAFEKIKSDPLSFMSFLKMPKRFKDEGMTANSLSDGLSFRTSEDGRGVVAVDGSGIDLVNDANRKIVLTWDDLEEASKMETNNDMEFTIENPLEYFNKILAPNGKLSKKKESMTPYERELLNRFGIGR